MPDSASANGLLDSAAQLIDNAIDLIGEDAVAAYLYDQFVKADIPYVPDSVEAMVVDPMAKIAITAFVKRLHATVHKPA